MRDKYCILVNNEKKYKTADEYVSLLINLVKSKYNEPYYLIQVLKNPAFKIKLEEKLQCLKEKDIESCFNKRINELRNKYISDLAELQKSIKKILLELKKQEKN